MKKTMQIHATLNALALAGLLAFTIAPAHAATTVTPATPATPATAPNAAVPATPATPAIDEAGTHTPEIGEVEAADDVANIAEHEVETPEVANIGAPEVDAPQVNLPEDR